MHNYSNYQREYSPMMYCAETSFSEVYRQTMERGILPLKFYVLITIILECWKI